MGNIKNSERDYRGKRENEWEKSERVTEHERLPSAILYVGKSNFNLKNKKKRVGVMITGKGRKTLLIAYSLLF